MEAVCIAVLRAVAKRSMREWGLTLEYCDFDLEVLGDRRVRASSDQGEVVELLALDRGELGLGLELVARGVTNEHLLKALGGELFAGLMPGDIEGHFRAALARAQANGQGVRLRLIIEPPELAVLPWELLFDWDTNTYLATSTDTALCRYIPARADIREIGAASPPLQILLVISDPDDLPRLDADGEERMVRDALRENLASGQIVLDVLWDATILGINRKLREKPYHVLHFSGHGGFVGGRGHLALLGDDRRARMVDDETFSNLFLGHRSLGLVVLNACRSAGGPSHRALAGMAPLVVSRGVPAVVSMQYVITEVTGKLFSAEFYHALGLGWPVDAAIQTTRNAIAMHVGLDRADFAVPVLYMRAKDGVVLSGL